MLRYLLSLKGHFSNDITLHRSDKAARVISLDPRLNVIIKNFRQNLINLKNLPCHSDQSLAKKKAIIS